MTKWSKMVTQATFTMLHLFKYCMLNNNTIITYYSCLLKQVIDERTVTAITLLDATNTTLKTPKICF